MMAWEKQGMVFVCVCVRVRVCVGEAGQKWDFGRASKEFASPRRAPSHLPAGANVIAGAVRAVMESLSVAVHM